MGHPAAQSGWIQAQVVGVVGFPSIRQKVVGAACQLAEAVGVVTDWLGRGEPVEDTT